MIAGVAGVSVFRKTFAGDQCPRCNSRDSQLLATTNEWRHYCPSCDVRFNNNGQVMPAHVPTDSEKG